MSDHDSEDELFAVGEDSPRRPAKHAEEEEAGDHAGGEEREEEAEGGYFEKAPASDEEPAGGNEEEENKEEEAGDYQPYALDDDENAEEIVYRKDMASDEEADYYEEVEGKKKKRNKKRGEEKKGRKKQKKVYDEAEEDPDAEEEEEGKSKKGRKKKDDEPDKTSIDDLLVEMDNAYQQDIEAMKAKRPALNKLSLLPKVESMLKRTANQRYFIEYSNGGLNTLTSWISKPPNGVAPSLQIKKRIVDLIYQLPVTEEHLKYSDLGKVLYTMKNNPNEDPSLRNTLKDIINKWTRLVTDMVDYSSMAEDMRDRKKITVSLDDYRQANMSSLKKSIPRMVNKRSGYDFMRKPSQEGSRFQNSRQDNEECDKLIKEMKRKVRKIKH